MIFVNHHHAYLVIGDKKDFLLPVLELATSITGVIEAVHPDKMLWDLPVWGVDDSRVVKNWQSRRPVGKAKCGVIVCSTMTEAAGQALLKVFEEPAPGVYFFILVPTESVIISTLHSRLIKLADFNISASGGGETKNLGTKFFSSTPVERLKQIEGVVEAKKLLEDLEKFLFANRSKILPLVIVEAGQVIKEIAESLNNPRFPNKLALEGLALTLPKVVL